MKRKRGGEQPQPLVYHNRGDGPPPDRQTDRRMDGHKAGTSQSLYDNYLRAEAFDENGDQQVEQDIVAESHEGYEIECGPVTCLFHAVEQDHVPVLLR